VAGFAVSHCTNLCYKFQICLLNMGYALNIITWLNRLCRLIEAVELPTGLTCGWPKACRFDSRLHTRPLLASYIHSQIPYTKQIHYYTIQYHILFKYYCSTRSATSNAGVALCSCLLRSITAICAQPITADVPPVTRSRGWRIGYWSHWSQHMKQRAWELPNEHTTLDRKTLKSGKRIIKV
jgi:hypothetical protein